MYLTGNILMVYNEPILTTDLVFLSGYPLRRILDAPFHQIGPLHSQRRN